MSVVVAFATVAAFTLVVGMTVVVLSAMEPASV